MTIVETLAHLPLQRWRQVTTRMGWLFRRDATSGVPPVELLDHWSYMPTRSAWDAVRKRVNTHRRHLLLEKKVVALAEKRVSRKDYMRVYMRTRRTLHRVVVPPATC